jgi:hypothetical protein
MEAKLLHGHWLQIGLQYETQCPFQIIKTASFVTSSSHDSLCPHKNCNMSMFSDDLLSTGRTKSEIIIKGLPDVPSHSPIKGLQDSE